jgi:hypothetical protein
MSTKIKADSSKNVNIGGIVIGGNVNSSAVITGNNNIVQNIAGGDISGDTYKISQQHSNLNDLMKETIQKHVKDKEQVDYLNEAIKTLNIEIKKGEKVDEGLVIYLLRSIREISPEVLDAWFAFILSQDNIDPIIIRLAKSSLTIK